MTTLLLTRLAGAALLSATLVLGQGGGPKAICDRQRIAVCYWGIADAFRREILAPAFFDRDNYLAELCDSDPRGLPVKNMCKENYYGSCTDTEKKEFASMERGYAALRAEITSGENCESVAQLGKCMDLDVMRSCDLKINAESFEKQVDEQNRMAQNLKACVEKAVKTCDPKKNAAAISHLQKIIEATIDLYRLSDQPNAAHTTQAATAVVAACLLSLVARNFF
ncbi:uncharacterized protein LOC119372162 [Rhipicephalus sanguineus]|uniref:uncharacterized protein LOC119372162 n=1 Tax=Rhipicephalus sanguineus TaxID=34632 RepID=UPI001893C6E1|nr:uncharacterized protein LOC119372162 [Rhipicephalus sanguineus]